MCKRITAVLLLVLLFAAQSAFAENDPLRGRYDALREQEIGLGLKKDQDALVALAADYAALGDYLDSSDRADAAMTVAKAIVASKYMTATDLIAAQKYGDATVLLMNFGDYGSEEVAAYYYQIAEKYLENQMLAELVALFKQAAKDPYAPELFLKPFYEKANALLPSAPEKAFQLFRLLGDYKDSAEKADAAYAALYAAPAAPTPTSPPPAPKAAATPKPQASGLSAAQVGDIITFGAYEQDNNKLNGKEPIQWRVLDKKNGRLLVISQYGLDCRQFHKSSRNRWKTCDLRKWLNKEFINAAFSPAELRQIPTVSLFTPTTHNSTEGDTTQDRVFLLSTQEAERYFRSDADRICKATAYTQKQGATTVDGDIGWWWLRSPGISEYSTVKVFTTGKIDYSGYNPNSLRGSIRPALWIELEP